MKLTTILIIFCTLQVSAKVEGQAKFSFRYKKTLITQILSAMEKQSNYRFLYNEDLKGVKVKASVAVEDADLKQVLDELLLNSGLTYQVMENNLVVIKEEAGEGQAPDPELKGKITDNNGAALGSASIQIKGTGKGTLTDATGAFSLVVTKGSTLVISSLGYADKEVVVGDDGFMTIQLVPSTKNLDEVVVVGYGQQKRGLVTGAISTVKADQLTTVSSGRIDQALQGRTAGVTVLPASGSPGAGMKVRIRGTGSNLSADPLYIVDGVRAGGIEYLDPSEIASVEVLKDAASAAIYGAEAANGVVLITTKMGRKGTPAEISYGMQYGQQSQGHKMKMMNPTQYVDYLKTSGTNTSNPLPDNPGSVQGTDWFDAIFQSAPIQRHSLNISGGSEKSSYLIAGTYYNQEGIVGGGKAKFDRATIRVNTDNRLKSWLNVGERMSFSHFTTKGVTEDSEFGSVINNALMMDPLTPVTYTSAPYPAHVQAAIDGGKPLVKDANGNYYGLSPYIFGEVSNPVGQMDITHSSTSQNKIVGNVYVDIEPFKGFKFTSRFGIDAAFQRIHGWNPTYWWSSERLNTAANTFDRSDNWFNWQWENFATYQKKFGDHNVSLLAGTSAIRQNYNYLNGTASGMFREADAFAYPDFEPDAQDKVNGIYETRTISSYYGRVGYDYKSKYLLNATIRRDGSSLVAPGHQWGTFPSVSGGWVVSNEGFYGDKVAGIMSYFKIRASWGKNGSLSNLSPGQWKAGIVTSVNGQPIQYPDATGGNLGGAAPGNLANADLTWETSEQIDFGGDLSFFKSRLNVTVDYYKKTTTDLITPGDASVPIFAGNKLPFINSGDIENKGWEFDVSFRSAPERAFKWEIGANLTTIKNEVTYLNPLVNKLGGASVGTGWTATYFEKGQPVWYFSGYKTDGIFQTQEQIDAYVTKNQLTGYAPKPGDPIVVDYNGDHQISNSDQTKIGSPTPKFVYGGRITLAYKGIDLLCFVQGQSGNDILMGFNRADRATANKPEFFYTDRWTGAGSTNTWFRPSTTDSYVYNSDLMVFDGSYMRIRQLQLGYTLPIAIMNRIKSKSLRIYISLDNFFTFTKYPGLDPEAGSNKVNSLGIDRGVYPIPKVAMAGLNFTF